MSVVLVLLLAATVQPEAAPTPTQLKTIIRVHSSPLCSTLTGSIRYTIQGLQANDRLIESAAPLLLQMASDFIAAGVRGKGHFGGAHDTNPALILNNLHLAKLATEIAGNLARIDAILNDQTRFPLAATTDDEDKILLIRSELAAVADQQRKTLNVLYGLSDTVSLQDLVAKGDGLQGTAGHASQDDQDISFQDILSASARARGAPIDPTGDQDPAIGQAPTDLSNNPMARFYLDVMNHQEHTASAENELTKSVLTAVGTCQ